MQYQCDEVVEAEPLSITAHAEQTMPLSMTCPVGMLPTPHVIHLGPGLDPDPGRALQPASVGLTEH